MVPFIGLTDARGVAGPLLGVKDDPPGSDAAIWWDPAAWCLERMHLGLLLPAGLTAWPEP